MIASFLFKKKKRKKDQHCKQLTKLKVSYIRNIVNTWLSINVDTFEFEWSFVCGFSFPQGHTGTNIADCIFTDREQICIHHLEGITIPWAIFSIHLFSVKDC